MYVIACTRRLGQLRKITEEARVYSVRLLQLSFSKLNL